MTTTTTDALGEFLDRLPPQEAVAARTLIHAWQGGGGRARVGKVAVRLLGGPEDAGFTAGTVHAHGETGAARLELCRIILERHGVDAERWTHWSDEFVDLEHHGFDAAAKFPTLPLAPITDTELARLVTGLRDLARLVA